MEEGTTQITALGVAWKKVKYRKVPKWNTPFAFCWITFASYIQSGWNFQGMCRSYWAFMPQNLVLLLAQAGELRAYKENFLGYSISGHAPKWNTPVFIFIRICECWVSELNQTAWVPWFQKTQNYIIWTTTRWVMCEKSAQKNQNFGC